jgi:hypothetical protein
MCNVLLQPGVNPIAVKIKQPTVLSIGGWHWQLRTEVPREETVTVSFCPLNISFGFDRDITHDPDKHNKAEKTGAIERYCIMDCCYRAQQKIIQVCPVSAGNTFCGEAWARGQGRWVKYRARWGSWISPCYGQLSLGARFETYDPIIFLIMSFFRAAMNRV